MDSKTLMILAAILAGEAPVALMGEDAAEAVAWTMRNRMEYWGHTVEQIKAAYFGRGQPTEAELEIVERVFAADRTEDPTDGAFWAMSRQDVESWGFPKGDLVFVSPKSAVYQIHLYREDPFKRGETDETTSFSGGAVAE
ncbi:MAG TPA: hypothetical protein G4O02_13360 [Caldilineae bacterium]|nr:hypothetical protein [Caldilineae bacterium]